MEIPRPFAYIICLTEVRSRVVQSKECGFVFGGHGAAVGGGDGAAGT